MPTLPRYSKEGISKVVEKLPLKISGRLKRILVVAILALSNTIAYVVGKDGGIDISVAIEFVVNVLQAIML